MKTVVVLSLLVVWFLCPPVGLALTILSGLGLALYVGLSFERLLP